MDAEVGGSQLLDVLELSELQAVGLSGARGQQAEALASELLERMARKLGADRELHTAVLAALVGQSIGNTCATPGDAEAAVKAHSAMANERAVMQLARNALEELEQDQQPEVGNDQ